MVKAKTKKAVQKRIKITAREKLKRTRGGKSHLMRRKRSRRRLKLKRPAYVSKVDAKKIKRMLLQG